MLDYTITYSSYVTTSSCAITYSLLVQNGVYMKTLSWIEPISLYDSTSMAAQYPLFLDGKYYKVLPRPYQNINQGWCGYGITNSTWL